MAEAEISVHLLGKQRGSAPDGERQIVPLQLARAAERFGARISDEERECAASAAVWTRTSSPMSDRRRGPAQVLCSFGMPGERSCRQRFVVGFGQFVIQRLDTNAPRRAR